MRCCSKCKTPLPGRRGHGFVVDGRLLCGRPASIEVGKVKYPGCVVR